MSYLNKVVDLAMAQVSSPLLLHHLLPPHLPASEVRACSRGRWAEEKPRVQEASCFFLYTHFFRSYQGCHGLTGPRKGSG